MNKIVFLALRDCAAASAPACCCCMMLMLVRLLLDPGSHGDYVMLLAVVILYEYKMGRCAHEKNHDRFGAFMG